MSNDRYPEEILDPDWDDGTMPDNRQALADAVVGHRIVNVSDNVPRDPNGDYWHDGGGLVITLDNGTQAVLYDTSDCCASTSIESFLLHPELVDHVITGVGTTDHYTKWHIYADLGDVLTLDVDWSAGNPFYYGYGFDIAVTPIPNPTHTQEN